MTRQEPLTFTPELARILLESAERDRQLGTGVSNDAVQALIGRALRSAPPTLSQKRLHRLCAGKMNLAEVSTEEAITSTVLWTCGAALAFQQKQPPQPQPRGRMTIGVGVALLFLGGWLGALSAVLVGWVH